MKNPNSEQNDGSKVIETVENTQIQEQGLNSVPEMYQSLTDSGEYGRLGQQITSKGSFLTVTEIIRAQSELYTWDIANAGTPEDLPFGSAYAVRIRFKEKYTNPPLVIGMIKKVYEVDLFTYSTDYVKEYGQVITGVVFTNVGTKYALFTCGPDTTGIFKVYSLDG